VPYPQLAFSFFSCEKKGQGMGGLVYKRDQILIIDKVLDSFNGSTIKIDIALSTIKI
jgi:hypothetical protein